MKLAVLADAAKYDASCASSGGTPRDSRATGGLGSVEPMGICHAYAPDGRCISLLKILLTNFCIYDCVYCVNRRTSNVRRARFDVEEVVRLTLDFYRRNYIEGLFLSSGVIRSPDHTMEELVRVARSLRLEHGFAGYIHLKTIPNAAPELLAEAGRWADRLSINVELPTAEGLERLAPEKNLREIRSAMARVRLAIEDGADARSPFAPAGQSTQMIVGADAATDRQVLTTSANLYANYDLRRIYYSAFSPIPDASSALPLTAPPLQREHRLYQADWLMRFYGFSVDELAPSGGAAENLALDVDPKTAWALRHPELFPVDLNRAPRETLLRVPGLGVKTVDRLLDSRGSRQVRLGDLARLRVSIRKIAPFVVTPDHRPTSKPRNAVVAPRQRDLFA